MHYKLQVDNGSAFKSFESEFSISQGVGVDVGYYWFGRTKGSFIGIGTGLHYEIIQSGMALDSSFYSRKLDNSDIPIGADNIINYEERIWINGFRQTLKFDLVSIPVMFNYMTELDSRTLFDIGIGTKISFVNKNKVNLSQSEGTATYKGWYEVKFPDQSIGEFLLEDIAEYGYENNKSTTIAKYNRPVNSPLIYLVVNPSFSIPINEIIPNSFIQIGMNFQYGLNSFYNISERRNYIMNSPGYSNDVFSSGVRKNDFVVGFTIGLRYFNSENHQKDKIFKF
jgi:hypothetical protein